MTVVTSLNGFSAPCLCYIPICCIIVLIFCYSRSFLLIWAFLKAQRLVPNGPIIWMSCMFWVHEEKYIKKSWCMHLTVNDMSLWPKFCDPYMSPLSIRWTPSYGDPSLGERCSHFFKTWQPSRSSLFQPLLMSNGCWESQMWVNNWWSIHMEFHAWIKQRVLKTLAWFCSCFSLTEGERDLLWNLWKKSQTESNLACVWRSHKQSLLVPLCAGTRPAKRARIPGNGRKRGPRVFYTFLGCECSLVRVHVHVFAPTHVEPSVFMFSELTDRLLFRPIPKSDLRGEESTDMNPCGDGWSSLLAFRENRAFPRGLGKYFTSMTLHIWT